MSSDQIKVVCVNVKTSDSPGKVKSKILKGLKRAERKSPTPICVSQPLQSWTKDLHSITDLPANEVSKVSSNSRFIVFLLKDGTVCRLMCTSNSSSNRKDSRSVLESLQRSTPTFQELSDAEYARQLQSDIMSGRATGEPHRVSQPLYPMEEDIDKVSEVIYLGTLYERNPEFYNNLSLSTPDIFPSSASLSSSPHSTGAMRRGSGGNKKERLGWPDVGMLEWAHQGPGPRFVTMAVLHSEILLVDSEGKLYSWRCDSAGGVTPHPLTASLGLDGERVKLVESGEVRVTLLTESGKMATFYDSLLRDVPGKGCPPLIKSLSHNAKTFPEFTGDPVTSLSVSNFITAVTTESGRVLWWGLCPKPLGHSSRPRGSSLRGAITDGSLVKLKDGPPCGPDAVVYRHSPTGTPLLGKTVVEHSGLNLRSSLLVKVYKDTPPEGQSSSAASSSLLKDIESSSHFEKLDVWKLSDVVFLDDSPSVLGRVVTVDQHQAIIDVANEATSSRSTLKVFKTSELELCLNTVPLSATATAAPSDQSTSQHIAGVVQHTPLLVASPATDLTEEASKPVISGFNPLALHTTNCGPSLLLERAADGCTFLVCSGQASHGPFGTSSFVALGLGSKPVRSTLPEESVAAVEGGLASRVGQAPSFVNCHNSQVLFLKDMNGQLLPLTDGLKLRPDLSTSSQTSLSAAYNCVHSRSYPLDKDKTAVVVVLIPRAKELMACASSGTLSPIQSYLSSLETGHQPKRKISSDEMPRPKKPRLASSIEAGTSILLEPAEASSCKNIKIPSDLGQLFECMEHNSNILHVCCELSRSGEDEHVMTMLPDPLLGGCGSERRLVILETLLHCQHIRPQILQLLCSKNAYGHTPFFSAIAKQNYDGAGKILDFVVSLSDPDLLQAAVLSPSSKGTTPLTQLFASLSPTFDLTSGRLLVTNIPSGYRAQALLRLFQLRYPSVYKVVISRVEEDETISDSSGDEESGESGIPSMLRQRVRGRRRHAHGNLSYHASSSTSLKGVVHFSDVKQLRAALVEMRDYKLSVGSSRNTGFGQSQQTNHLSVQLADTEEESGPTTMASAMAFFDGISTKSKQKGAWPSGGGLFNGIKHSRPSLAYTLLTKLLSLQGVSTSQGEAKETTLSSIVHNTKCLEALSEIKKGQSSSTTSANDSAPNETPLLGASQEVLRNLTSLTDIITGEHSLSPDGPPVPDRPPPLMPYTSLADYLSNFPTPGKTVNVGSAGTPGEKAANTSDGGVTQETGGNATASSATPLLIGSTSSYKTSKGDSVCSCRQRESAHMSGVDLLESLTSNWPCLVTTILGFYPTDDCDSYTFSSVHSLDSFTSSLLLNCDSDTVKVVMDTIVSNMNTAISSVIGSKDMSLLTNDVDWINAHNLKITKKNVPLVVGRRFVESAVRVLAMNHSRAGSTLSNTQLSRQPESGRNIDLADPPQQSSRTTGGQSSQRGTSTKEFSQTITSVLSRFSWLSVSCLVQAAEASIAPVRLGVAKPLGASSVASEYQQVPSYAYSSSYSRRSSTPSSGLQTISRVMHTRTALKKSELATDSNLVCPPSSGVILTPIHSVGAGSESVGGEGGDSDMDMSDQEEPPTRSSTRLDNIESVFTLNPGSITVPAFSFLDLDTDQSDDEDYALPGAVYHFEGDITGQSEESDEERLEDIYPYAWALDGRRIGETSSGGNHQNVMANITLGSADAMIPLASIPSIRFGSGFLARTFARLVKDMVDIVKQAFDGPESETTLLLPHAVRQLLMRQGVESLDKTWAWVASTLDVAEGQLECGEQFDTERHVMSLRTGGRQSGNGRRSGRTSRSFIGSTPSEYIAYLLRSHAQEDQQSLPVLDLYGYEHVVYCLDGLLYLLTHLPKKAFSAVHTAAAPTPTPVEQSEEQNITFFARSESVTLHSDEVKRSNDQFFGEKGESISQPVEAYPLAKQPHLLQPYAQREQLFGGGAGETVKDVNSEDAKTKKKLLPVSYTRIDSSAPASITTSWTLDQVHQRWSTAISVFAHIFLAEGPGGERSNFLNSKAGFASRMARFRHQVAQLYTESQMSRDWSRTVSNTFSIRVRREYLLQDSLDMLLTMSRFHYSSIRVKFEGEDGSGPGVNRGFFASLANDLINSDLTKSPINKLGRLLHQPGKLPEQLGAYAPCPFVPPHSTPQSKIVTAKTQRKSTFLSIGRFLGLCLWFKYTIPLTLCRHVAKFLLGRDIAWHDLAFYNADLYEGMRRMMVDTETGKKDSEEFMATYCCYFEAPLSGQFSEPLLVDLIPGGSKIPVTPSRVHEYVRLYAMFTMVGCVKDELEAMKEGLNDVVPPELLSSLTAEDFQLLLSGGSMDISVARLKTVIRFNHTHGGSSQFRQNFERMFWRVVKHMTNTQRQQLLYFATGSAALPATTDVTNTDTPIAITIDVINSSDVDSLPVASTCSQRMSLPLYPSYTILKKKLLQAIQCQAYGLG